MSLMNRSALNSVRGSIGMGQGNIRSAGTRNKDMANTDNAVSWNNPGMQENGNSSSPYNFSQSNPFGMSPGGVQPSPFPSPQPMGNPISQKYPPSPVQPPAPAGGQAGGGGGETGPLTLQQPMPTFSPPRGLGQRGYDAMVAQQQANRPFWMGTRRPATPPAPVKPQVGYDGNIDPPPVDNNTSYVQPNFAGGY